MCNLVLKQVEDKLSDVLFSTSSGSDGVTLEWKLRETKTLSLKRIVDILFPRAKIPDELLTLEFEDFLLKFTPVERLFEIDASCTRTWKLPLGGTFVSAGQTKMLAKRIMPDDDDDDDGKEKEKEKEAGVADKPIPKEPIIRIDVEVNLEDSFTPIEGVTFDSGGKLLFKYNPKSEEDTPESTWELISAYNYQPGLFQKQWRHIVSLPGVGILYYNANGAVEIERVSPQGMSPLITYPAGQFTLNWKHLIHIPKIGIFCYDTDNDLWSLDTVDPDGQIRNIRNGSSNFSGAWTQVVHVPEVGIFFYSNVTGGGALFDVDETGTFRQIKTYSQGSFAPNWSSLLYVPEIGLLCYETTSGKGTLYNVDTDGTFNLIVEYASHRFTPGWTHLVPIPGMGIFCLNQTQRNGILGKFTETKQFKSIKTYPNNHFSQEWTNLLHLPELGVFFYHADSGTAAIDRPIWVQSAATKVEISDPFKVLAPEEEEEKDDLTWLISGSLSASFFQRQVQFGIELEETKKKRSLKLTGKLTGLENQNLISIGEYAWIKSSELEIKISRAKGESDLSAGQKSLTAANATSIATSTAPSIEKAVNGVTYTWSVVADSRFGFKFPGLEGMELGGKLSLAKEDDGISFSFLPPPESRLQLQIPFPLNDDYGKTQFITGTIYPGGVKFERKTKDNETHWQFAAQVGFGLSGFDQLSGMHENARRLFADFQRQITHRTTATFSISDQGVLIGVDRLLNPVEFNQPPVSLPDMVALAKGTQSSVVFDLSTAALDAGNFYFRYHTKDGLGLSMDFGYGIPAEMLVTALSLPEALIKQFNTFSKNALNSVFNTYNPHTKQGITSFRLMLTERDVLFTLVDSPFKFLTLKEDKDDAKKIICTLDFEDYGAVQFDVPKFKFDGTSLSAKGGFKIVNPLKIPTILLKTALANIGVMTMDKIDRILPDKLSLVEVNLLDSNNQLNVEAFEKLLQKSGLAPNSPELQLLLQELKKGVGYLPNTLREYLNISIPDQLSFEISISAEGSIRFDIATGAKPIKFLVTDGMGLLGIQLSKIMLGELMSGALLMADASITIDYFPFGTLIPSMIVMAATSGKPKYLLPSNELRQRFIVDKLLLLIIYQTQVPIPIPIFYDEIGIESFDASGCKMEMHFGFPQPQFNLVELFKIAIDLGKFFTNKEALLDDGGAGNLVKFGKSNSSMDITLRVGKNYIQLPPYITDENGNPLQLGINLSKQLEFSALRSIAAALNATKKQSVNYLIQTLPVNLRIGERKLKLFNVISLEAAWMIATPKEFEALAYWHENLEFAQQKLGLMRLAELGVNHEDQVELQRLGWLEPEKVNSLMSSLFPDQEQLKRTINLLPQGEGEGVFFCARGVWKLLNSVTLDTRVGYGMTQKGMIVHVNSTGAIDIAGMGNILKSELSAEAYVVQQTKDLSFLLQGSFNLTLMGNKMFGGSVSLSNDAFEVEGQLDLFPGNSLIDVIGELKGQLREGNFELCGQSRVSLFNDTVKLADCRVMLRSNDQDSQFSIGGSLLGSELSLNASASGGNFMLDGTIKPFVLSNSASQVLSFGGSDGSASPSFNFSTGSQGTQLRIDGSVTFLDRTYRGQLIYSPDGSWKIKGVFFDGILSTYKLEVSGSGGDDWFRNFQVNVQSYFWANPDSDQLFASDEAASMYLLQAHRTAIKSIEVLEPQLFRQYGGRQTAAERLTPIGKSTENSPVLNLSLHEQSPGVGKCQDGHKFIVAVSGPNQGVWSTYINRGIEPHQLCWVNHGGEVRGEPAATEWKSGQLWLFARGTDNQLYRKRYTPEHNWLSWEPLGDYTLATPVANLRGTHPTDLNLHHTSAVEGSSCSVYSRWWNASEGSRNDRVPSTENAANYSPALVTRPRYWDVTIYVSRLRTMYYLSDRTKIWYAWGNAQFLSSPVTAVNGNRFGVAARMSNHHPGFAYTVDDWDTFSAWTQLSIKMTGKPALTLMGGYYRMYVRNADDGCVYDSYASVDNPTSWSNWSKLTEFPIVGSPTAFSLNSGHIGVVARTAHNAIVYIEWTGTNWRTVLLGSPWR